MLYRKPSQKGSSILRLLYHGQKLSVPSEQVQSRTFKSSTTSYNTSHQDRLILNGLPVDKIWTKKLRHLRRVKGATNGEYKSDTLSRFNVSVADMEQYDIKLYDKTQEILDTWVRKVGETRSKKTQEKLKFEEQIESETGNATLCESWINSIYESAMLHNDQLNKHIREKLAYLNNALKESIGKEQLRLMKPNIDILFQDLVLDYAKNYHSYNRSSEDQIENIFKDRNSCINYFARFIALTKLTKFSETVSKRMLIDRIGPKTDDEVEICESFRTTISSTTSKTSYELMTSYDKLPSPKPMHISSTDFEKFNDLINSQATSINKDWLIKCYSDMINCNIKLTELETQNLITSKLKNETDDPGHDFPPILNFIDINKDQLSLSSAMYNKILKSSLPSSSSPSSINAILSQMSENKIMPNRDTFCILLDHHSSNQNVGGVIDTTSLLLHDFKCLLTADVVENIVSAFTKSGEAYWAMHFIFRVVQTYEASRQQVDQETTNTDSYQGVSDSLKIDIIDYLSLTFGDDNLVFKYPIKPTPGMIQPLYSYYSNLKMTEEKEIESKKILRLLYNWIERYGLHLV